MKIQAKILKILQDFNYSRMTRIFEYFNLFMILDKDLSWYEILEEYSLVALTHFLFKQEIFSSDNLIMPFFRLLYGLKHFIYKFFLVSVIPSLSKKHPIKYWNSGCPLYSPRARHFTFKMTQIERCRQIFGKIRWWSTGK